MTHPLIHTIEQAYTKAELPDINTGDTVKVNVRIREGAKERLQAFEGVVIRQAGSGTSRTITVRRVFQGIGVERIFLLHSPRVEGIKVLRRGRVRRSRIYYMRGRAGKAARIREKLSAYKLDEANKKAAKKAAPKADAPKPEPAAEPVAPDSTDAAATE